MRSKKIKNQAVKHVIGTEEWCALPDLNIPAIRAKIDSGADLSSIHAVNISIVTKLNDEQWVNFDVLPLHGNMYSVIKCSMPMINKKVIRTSNNEVEMRPIIATKIKLGDRIIKIKLALSNRDTMECRLLLGKHALRDNFMIDLDKTYTLGDLDVSKLANIYSVKQVRYLRIALLASNHQLYSNVRIMECARMRGHKIDFINIKHCHISVHTGSLSVYHRDGKKLFDFDAIIPRIRPSLTFYGCALLNQFRTMGKFCLNDAQSTASARDKLRCLQILSSKGIAIPHTSFASSPRNSKALIDAVGGTPLVIKLLTGTHGNGVMLATNYEMALSLISAFGSVRASILVQDFVEEAFGKDVRCFVIDNTVVAAMERQSISGDFRANIHLGGVGTVTELSRDEKSMALNATKALGLKIAGVDIVRSSDGPKVLEVNACPGLEGIEKATGKNIADMIIACVEKYVWCGDNY